MGKRPRLWRWRPLRPTRARRLERGADSPTMLGTLGPKLAIPSGQTRLTGLVRLRHLACRRLLAARTTIDLWLRRGAATTAALEGWDQLNPATGEANPFGIEADLNDVASVAASTIVAVGDRGAIVRSTDFGLGWSEVPSGTTRNLYGVALSDQGHGLAVGDAGTILRTEDAGLTWVDVTPGELWSLRDTGVASTGPNGTNYLVTLPDGNYRLDSVALDPYNRAVAVGRVSDRAFILRSEDAGITWADVSDWSIGSLNAVAYHQDRFVAVGGQTGASGGEITLSPYGRTWLLAGAPTLFSLRTVGFSTPTIAFAAANEDSFLRTTTAGEAWSLRPSPLPSYCWQTSIFDIDFGSQAAGMIVADYGLIARTTDGGEAWDLLGRETRLPLRAVSMPDEGRAVTVGHGFTALATEDGGASWRGPVTLTLNELRGVSFADPQRGMLVGDRGDIFRTTDGGVTWEPLDLHHPDGFQWPLDDVFMLDASTALVVGPNLSSGGWVWKTTDFGATWTRIVLADDPSGLGSIQCLSFADGQQGLGLGPQRLVRTTDAGESWTPLPMPEGASLRALQLVTPAVAFAVGERGVILRSVDGGATWESLAVGASNLLLGLTFIDAAQGWVVGAKLPDIPGADENVATSGVVLRTQDGGDTWESQETDTDLPLRGVSFLDARVGFAVGGKGWENYVDPERPIALRTTDGGVTWSSQTFGSHVKNLNRVVLLGALTAVAIGRNGTIIRTTTGGA